MKASWLVFTIWAAVAASALHWGLQLFDHVAQSTIGATITPASVTPTDDLNVLRERPPPQNSVPAVVAAVESSRFQLFGVVAPRNPNSSNLSVALLAIDGQPARAFRIGDKLNSDWVLQAVQVRGVSIGPLGGTTAISLELPALESAATASKYNGEAAMQQRQSQQMSSVRPPTFPASSGQHGNAPNTLLNNPADMAPADASASNPAQK